MEKSVLERIEKMIVPILHRQDLELVDIEWGQRGKSGNLCIYIDKPGGVTIADCQSVSYEISDLLDREDPISDRYSLEVSSPGLDRPLKKQEDFKRSRGNLINVEINEPLQNRKRFQGTLTEASDESFIIRTDSGEEYELFYKNVKKANICYRPDFKR